MSLLPTFHVVSGSSPTNVDVDLASPPHPHLHSPSQTAPKPSPLMHRLIFRIYSMICLGKGLETTESLCQNADADSVASESSSRILDRHQFLQMTNSEDAALLSSWEMKQRNKCLPQLVSLSLRDCCQWLRSHGRKADKTHRQQLRRKIPSRTAASIRSR